MGNTIKTKKTLFLLPALTAGGAERVLINLMNNIDRTKFTPEILVINNEGPLGALIAPDIPFHTLSHKKVETSLFKLYLQMKEIKPDIVVSTMGKTNFAALLLKPFFPNTRFIVRESITPSFVLDKVRLRTLTRFLYRWLYPKAHLVISPARRIIDEFRDLLDMDVSNHAVLHNPVDIKKMRGDEKTIESNITDRNNTVHFICAGRLIHQKGFDRLIKRLPELTSKWHLTILGEGEDRAALERLIQNTGVSENVSMPGLVQKPWPEIAAADCFLMPSRWEGLPNAVLEALTCGTPVIATSQSGGVQEIADRLEHKDALTIVSDMDEFIQAMQKITPAQTKTYRASLLPNYFAMDAVVSRFEDMLEDTNISSNS